MPGDDLLPPAEVSSTDSGVLPAPSSPDVDGDGVLDVVDTFLPAISAHHDPMAKSSSRERAEALLRSATPTLQNAPDPVHAPMRGYPSLYDSTGTTIIAIVLGIIIVGGIQWFVQRLFAKSRSEHELLTRFVVTLVALVVGAYITDLLIAGPDTSLLSDDEHTIILGFIKDVCLMVFAYFFGTKASSPPPPSPSEP